MRQYLHLKLITGAENKVLQDAILNLEKIDNNQYITTADSNGLKLFEQMLGISTLPSETLESRRKKILSKWNDQDTYTYAAFLKKLDIICGSGKYRIVDYFKQYMIELHTNLSAYGEMEELERVIDYMIPCNIQMNVSNDLVWEVHAQAGIGCFNSYIDVFDCFDSFKESYEVRSVVFFSGASTEIMIIDGSDNSNEKIEVQSSLNIFNVLSECTKITVSDDSNEVLNINSDASFGAGLALIEVITNAK